MTDQFATLATKVRKCRLCVENPNGKPLPHEPRPILVGSQSARILIVGQAPGTRVHASGKPFTDPSGDRLRQWMGVDEKTFYDPAKIAIVPMGFCFPGLDAKGSDLPPRRECAPAWRDQVMATLPNIELIIAVGLYALKWHLGPACGKSLGATLLSWREHAASTPPLIALPHPSWRNTSYLKRNPYIEAEIIPAVQGRVADIFAD